MEKVRLRIGSLARAVLITGQAYQDPKDALNEFISNAADEYVLAGIRGGTIRILLRRKGRYPVVAVDDEGRGMDPDRLKEVARNLFKSVKAGDERTLGEKAIGLLAFQQLGRRCEIVSRADGTTETWSLRLERGSATAELARERRRARTSSGTTVFLSDLDPDALRTLTQRKIVDYMRRRRGPALERGDYRIEVVEGRSSELVTPEIPDGMRVPLNPWQTLWGTVEFNLFVAPLDGKRRQVAVVGKAGTTILDHIGDLEEFVEGVWSSGQVSGQVVFAGLQQTAGRRAVIRDRDGFPVFLAAVQAVEGLVAKAIERVNAEVDRQTADRLSSTLRRVFGLVLKELADLDNPMRSPVGAEEGQGGLLFEEKARDNGLAVRTSEVGLPSIEDLTPSELIEQKPPDDLISAGPEAGRSSRLPSVSPDPDLGERRSRFDPESGVVFYNDHHPDFLLIKDDETLLLDYLAILVAKEYVVFNNPRANPDDLAEELVRMLVRVRRHLPRRKG
jgi:hypothetical protein